MRSTGIDKWVLVCPQKSGITVSTQYHFSRSFKKWAWAEMGSLGSIFPEIDSLAGNSKSLTEQCPDFLNYNKYPEDMQSNVNRIINLSPEKSDTVLTNKDVSALVAHRIYSSPFKVIVLHLQIKSTEDHK